MGDGRCFFLGAPAERPPSAKMATLQSGLWSVPGNKDPRTSEIKSCFNVLIPAQVGTVRDPHTPTAETLDEGKASEVEAKRKPCTRVPRTWRLGE